MIRLDYELLTRYQLSGGGRVVEPPCDLRSADEIALRYDCFHGDVVFVVDDVDMSARWGHVPILDFALALSDIARALTDGATERFLFTDSGGTITFARQGSHVVVDADYAEGRATVDAGELRTETSKFSTRVLDDMQERFPEARQNAYLAALRKR